MHITKNNKQVLVYWIMVLGVIVLFMGNLVYGSVRIPVSDVFDILFSRNTDGMKPSWIHIVMESRLPQAVTGLLAGAGLAVCGLLLQTLFRNPLAGPSILGISDGANLGVALVMLYVGSSALCVPAAFLGSGLILAVIIYFSSRVRNNVMLLIIGIMVGYMTSSVISVLNFYSSADKVQQFVMWGMGNFSSVTNRDLPVFAVLSLSGLFFSLMLMKPLNALLLGDNYAENLGVNLKRTRFFILFVTGLLTAVITAYCGPVSFIGLAVPHIARLLLGNSNHKQLLPVTMISGAAIALLCNILVVVPGANIMMPLNAVTPIIGAPVIIYVIVNRRNIQYFN